MGYKKATRAITIPTPMAKTIKLLECIRQGQIGGGESHLLSLVENLDRTRFEPLVLSFTDGPMVERLSRMGVRTHVIHTERPFDITKWAAVKKFLKDEQVELVHAHGTRACSNVVRAAQSLGIPVIYTVHGWSFHDDQHPLVRRIRMLGEKYLTSNTTVNISVSASNRQTGKDAIRNFSAIVISNGIDRKKFNPEGSFKDIRAELGIPSKAVLVLFLARFTSHKQPLALIRAFEEALKSLPDMRLLLVGDGDQKSKAMEIVRRQGLEEAIFFQPFRQDVPDILAAADIFVLPSLWEGLPIGLLEAMAMGKAVIATNVDGTKEVVDDLQNGLLIEAGNITALTEALLNLGGNEIRRKEFSSRALDTVRLKYDAADMTQAIEEVYRTVLEKEKMNTANKNDRIN
jgi:glycosyltransferase involved in cell wall biosynthesis